jgi:hypothetical protein
MALWRPNQQRTPAHCWHAQTPNHRSSTQRQIQWRRSKTKAELADGTTQSSGRYTTGSAKGEFSILAISIPLRYDYAKGGFWLDYVLEEDGDQHGHLLRDQQFTRAL